jgi:hypothetical protein
MCVHAALLAIGNESAMNLKAVGGVFFDIFGVSCSISARWQRT